MKNIKILAISIIIPIIVGIISSILGNSNMGFDLVNKPSFNPPAIVFPIVWTILYVLMGVSSYLIFISKNKNKNKALKVYLLSLIFNMLWTFFFFNLKWYFFSFLWIIALIILVIITIYRYLKINKLAGYLQIPYLIWLIFAAILNLSIFFLN